MARVKRIRIRNLLGIEELEIEPGKVTVIQGPNASGKTSVLEVIKAIVGGGHDATLLRKGADEGEGVLVLEDEGGEYDGVEFRKSVKPHKSELDVVHPKLGSLKAPQSIVNGLVDALSVNPVRFLTAGNRVEILLDALAVEVGEDALAGALEGIPEDEIEADPETLVQSVVGLPATDAIERLRNVVYKARTGTNRVVREKRTTADQLRSTVPEDAGDVEELEEEIRVAEESVDALREEANEKAREVAREEKTLREEVGEEEDAKLEAIYAERDEKVAALQAKIDKVKAEAGEEANEIVRSSGEKRQKISRDASDRLAAIKDEYEPRISETREEISALRERVKAADGALRTRNLIAENETEAATYEEKSDALTAAINRLEALKSAVLEDLPIEGATIEEGEIYVDGVPFDRVNTADRVDFALRVAKLRAGDLGLVCVDDLELLDSDHFEEITRRLKEDPDLQAIVTRVSDDAFEIRTEE